MNGPAPVLTEALDPLAIELDREELLRHLGYRGPSAVGRHPPEAVERELVRGRPLLQPKGVYAVHPVEQLRSQEIVLGGTQISGQVASFVAGADRIAVFVVSVGLPITTAARAAAATGDMLASWTLDVLGSCAAEAATRALAQHVRERFRATGSVSQRFSPGYCGMPLSAQSSLFRLVAADVIGVSLEPSMLMQPIKSVSGLLGIGAEGAFAPGASVCDLCGDSDCAMRR